MEQTRQPIFVQLLHAAFKVSQCAWLNAGQRFNVENCIRTLSDVGRYPLDSGKEYRLSSNVYSPGYE